MKKTYYAVRLVDRCLESEILENHRWTPETSKWRLIQARDFEDAALRAVESFYEADGPYKYLVGVRKDLDGDCFLAVVYKPSSPFVVSKFRP